MKKRLLVTALALASSPAMAINSVYLDTSTGVTAGSLTSSALSSSGRYSPAGSYISTNRFNTNLDFSGGASFSGLGSFLQAGDDLSEEGEEFETRLDEFQEARDNNSSDTNTKRQRVQDQAQVLENTLDGSVELLADTFSLKPGASFSIPLQFKTPYAPGAFSFGFSYMSQARATMLYDTVEIVIPDSAIDGSDDDFDAGEYVDSASSIYIKSGRLMTFDLGYSQALPGINFLNTQTVVGGRVNVIGATLFKGVYPVSEFLSEATKEGGDVANYTDQITDDIQQGLISGDMTFTAALDLGVHLEHPNGHIGISGYNLNSPEISYNDVGVNCSAISDTYKQTSCNYANYFGSIGEIARQESHVMSPQFVFDGAYRVWEDRITMGGSIDVIPKTDLFGDQSQRLNVAFVAKPNAWYYPQTRFSFGKDFQDFDPTNIAFGMTLFNVLQFDQSVSAVWGDLFGGNSEEQFNALRGATTSLSLNASF